MYFTREIFGISIENITRKEVDSRNSKKKYFITNEFVYRLIIRTKKDGKYYWKERVNLTYYLTFDEAY
jgi:hypothetical protein